MTASRAFRDCREDYLERKLKREQGWNWSEQHGDLVPPSESEDESDRAFLELVAKAEQERESLIPDTLCDAAVCMRRRFGWSIMPVIDKRPLIAWEPLQKEPPNEEMLRCWFGKKARPTGMAVINGSVSGNLACRDFDNPMSYQAWGLRFPELKDMLPTVKTSKGYHVYYKELSISSTRMFDDGELRRTGYNVLPPSRHTTGSLYEWLTPPSTANLIELPQDAVAALSRCWTEKTDQTDQTEHPEQTNQTETTDADGSHEGDRPFARDGLVSITPELERIIMETLPTVHGQRNRMIFVLARRLRSLEGENKLDPRRYRGILEEWHRRARGVIRTKAFPETWMDFLTGYSKVKFAACQDPVMKALEDAQRVGPPPEVHVGEEDEVKVAAALCRELQRVHGSNPFFLSCRKLGEVMNMPHSNANVLLRYLLAERLITEVEKGKLAKKGGKASRYRYMGRLE